jgi:hypothetical protein
VSDVGDLLELLHGARHRWQTLRCSMRTWHHVARGRTATERWIASSQGSGTMRYAGDPEGEPETYEREERLWFAKPDRARQESDDHVSVTRGAVWRSWSVHHGFMSNEHDQRGGSDPLQSYAAHFDPSVLIPQVEVETIDGNVVRVVPRAGQQHGLGLLGGADEHVLTVDGRGIVTRIESLVEGEPFFVSELLDAVWDEPIPDSVFTLEVAEGEAILSPDELHALDLSIEEAAARAGFGVWGISELPEGAWRARAHLHSARGLSAERLTIIYNRVDGRGLIHVLERTGDDRVGWSQIHGAAEVTVEREGTRVSLQSEDYDEQTLQSLAETLVRV